MTNLPIVSVIIPCRNEERFIGECLDSILANDYPKDRLELLVVDGMSEDGTRALVEEYSRRHAFVRLLDNPKRIPAAAFNRGLAAASGDVVMLMSAHATCPRDYISTCVRYLDEYNATNCGGILKITPGGDTTVAKAIALALSHPFGSGNAYVKTGSKEPRWADTAAFGCYRKEVFEEIGLFNEELGGSSDMDFNVRLRAAGGKILLVPEIVINYYADSDLEAFLKHNFADGVWATYVLKFKSRGFSVRHLVPLAFVLGVIGSGVLSTVLPPFRWLFGGIIGAYALANFAASVHLGIQKRCLSYLWIAPLVFAIRHIAHGLGALVGLVLVPVPGKPWKGRYGFLRK
jgi:cellulose synthase/poly-beta-1,6-N-acetylglucosamine synthase-like glycosyltransferase